MIKSVERRFGLVNRLPAPIEWLSDNGSPYTARETRAFARDIGLVPRTTPIESPQSNGMAEAFVKLIKRDRRRSTRSPVPQASCTGSTTGSSTIMLFTRTRRSATDRRASSGNG